MKYLALNTVRVIMTKEEFDSFTEKFGDFDSKLILFYEHSWSHPDWWDKFYTFFGGIDNKTQAILIQVV